MAKREQLRRGTTASHTSFTGAMGELTMDTTKKILVLHDGVTVGGKEVSLAGFGLTFTAAQINSLTSDIQASIDGAGILGSIVAIASNLSGAHAIPATGVVDSNGWMYCNGAAIPAGNSVSGTTPDLTDGRFMRGSTSAGGTGGADSFTLATINIPVHTHSTSNHTHTGTVNSTGAHTHFGGVWTENYGATIINGAGQYGGSAKNAGVSGGSGVSGISSSAGTHSHTITVNSGGAGTTGSAGSTKAKSHIPKYIDVQYIIKVN